MSRRVFVRNLGGTPTVIHTADAINPFEYGAIGDGVADDTAALQAAIDAAIETNLPLRIPVGRFKYVAPLTIDGNVTIEGNGVTANWGTGIDGDGINVPVGGPPIFNGTVLYPSSNGANAIDITGGALEVHLRDFGIEFQTQWVGTGHAFAYNDETADQQGLTASTWQNLKVWGHDGNHYAYELGNPIYCTFIHCQGFGGGLIHMEGNSANNWHYGNALWLHPYGQVIVGGSAHGVFIEANAGATLNLLTFVRPQCSVTQENGPGGGSAPTSAQATFTMNDEVLGVHLIAPNFETTVSSPFEWNPHPSNVLLTHSSTFPPGNVYPSTLLAAPQVRAIIPGSNMHIQSGEVNNGAGTGTITFPFPFDHECFVVMVTASNPTILPTVDTGTITVTDFDLSQASGGTVWYLAYGY